MAHLIDRRKNAPNKSAVNRARFIRRYKEQIRRAVDDAIADRSISDMERGADVSLPGKDISEPTFRHGEGGDREVVHPGNRRFVAGDRLPRSSRDGGEGQDGAGSGSTEDDFVFALSREEFLQVFFEDLELPRLERNMLLGIDQYRSAHAGFTTVGSPANLSVLRTMRQTLARRIALGTPLARQLHELADELAAKVRDENAADDEVNALQQRIDVLVRRLRRIRAFDELDLRYRNRVQIPEPSARAVMFCLMDVSASMDEEKKDLAKRFFTLLHLFLTRKYNHVEVVFVRHTEDAEEVDEQTFFYDRKSGGTVVLSALQLMAAIVAQRYSGGGWNVYTAQASDGDAFGADAGKSAHFLADAILPLTRYFAYLETPDDTSKLSGLWVAYEGLHAPAGRFAMRRVTRREEIYPVFRQLFRKDAGASAA